MILVFLLYFLTFIFFLNEKKMKVHAAIISGFLTAFLVAVGHLGPREVYLGFSDSAVVTVVLMLIMTGILERSGVINLMVHWVTKYEALRSRIALSLFVIVVLASAVMNDVGALAIILPAALTICQRFQIPPATVFMPLSFGALLGGMLTKVGTPPNIIISNFREAETGVPFAMFDYTPVGIVMCVVGGMTIFLLRKRVFADSRYQILSEKIDHPLSRGYISLLIGEESPLIGIKSRKFKSSLIFPTFLLKKKEGMWQVFPRRPWDIALEPENVIIVKVDNAESTAQCEIVEDYIAMGLFTRVTDELQDEICEQLMHVCSVHRSSSLLKNEEDIAPAFRQRFNLLRLHNNEKHFTHEACPEQFEENQQMIFLGDRKHFVRLIDHYRLVEIDESQVAIAWPRFRRVVFIFGSAILLGALGVLRLELALGLAVLIFLSIREVSWEQISKSVDVPLVTLIATMLVNAKAFEATGAAELLADTLLALAPQSPTILLWVTIGVTIIVTNVVNNAACATMMAPVGISFANALGVSSDPFLLGICIGSSCAFCVPTAHPCNLQVYAYYDFGSYFRLGIWVSIAVWIAASVSIPFFWEF
jgi:di/tricarboxylate transporter